MTLHLLLCVTTHACAGGLARAMQGVKSVIVLGKLGSVLPAAERAGVERVVMLSTAGEWLGRACDSVECVT